MMTPHAFDAITSRAAEGISRRRSLLTLGGAVLGATIARPTVGEAKKKGNRCKQKEKQRCSKDAAACKTTVQATQCGSIEPAQCTALQKCCDSCSANGFVICLTALQS
jgi:hypothetical protein